MFSKPARLFQLPQFGPQTTEAKLFQFQTIITSPSWKPLGICLGFLMPFPYLKSTENNESTPWLAKRPANNFQINANWVPLKSTDLSDSWQVKQGQSFTARDFNCGMTNAQWCGIRPSAKHILMARTAYLHMLGFFSVLGLFEHWYKMYDLNIT